VKWYSKKIEVRTSAVQESRVEEAFITAKKLLRVGELGTASAIVVHPITDRAGGSGCGHFAAIA
jgi:hypothetical protein